MLERLPAPPADDQDLPLLRLALHDWTIAWDRRTGAAWLAGRALDGDADRLAGAWPRSASGSDPAARRGSAPARDRGGRSTEPRRSRGARLPLVARPARPTRPASRRVRERIARGDLYQANLTRRLATPVRRRSVAALPPAADRRPVALLGVPRPRRRRAGSRLRARQRARPAAGDPVGLARAVPRDLAARRRLDRPDQGHAAARPDARGGPRPRPRAPRRRPRTGPRT